jgi:hypothetical protein
MSTAAILTSTEKSNASWTSWPIEKRRKLAARLRERLGPEYWQGPEGIAAFASECHLESPEHPDGECRFEPYPYQVDYWAAILEEIERHRGGQKAKIIHVEKSRQLGITWASALFILWSLAFIRSAFRALVLSYNFSLVDDGGQKASTDSIFGKVLYLWESLPPDMRALLPLDFRLGRIVNTQTGATIIGRSTNPTSRLSGGGGRGGSYLYGFHDEQAFGAHGFQTWAGFKRAVRVPICQSTPNGKANIFGWLRFKATAGVRFLRFHWSDHPIFGKDAHIDPATGHLTSPWYEAECAGMPAEDIARELDISYEASVKGRALPEFSVEVHVKEGVEYGGGRLFSSWDFGIRASAVSIHEARPEPNGALEIATLAAFEFQNATADILAEAFRGEIERITGSRDTPCRNFGDPAGHARTQTTGTSFLDEMSKLGVGIEAPMRLRDVQHRIRTTRLMLAGKEINGRLVRYVCVADDGEGSRGLAWFCECLEQVRWPTDTEGFVKGSPTDLEDSAFTHHADAFTYGIEGLLGMAETAPPPRQPENATRPLTAGMGSRRF